MYIHVANVVNVIIKVLVFFSAEFEHAPNIVKLKLLYGSTAF